MGKNEKKIADLEAENMHIREEISKQQEMIQQIIQDAANREQYELDLANMEM